MDPVLADESVITDGQIAKIGFEEIGAAKVLRIRDCGHDEYWLRDRIFENPAILGLGELQAVMKEMTQSQGGRLDLLLKNPAEDDAMFEVEFQLESTDATHIIRTIEYWDSVKRVAKSQSHRGLGGGEDNE